MHIECNIFSPIQGIQEKEKREKEAKEDAIKMCVMHNKDSFNRFINKHELHSKMVLQGLFTPKESDMFMRGDHVDINFLIATLEKKSSDAFTRFYDALKSENSHLGHQDLANLIEQEFSVLV